MGFLATVSVRRSYRVLGAACACLFLANCGSASRVDPKYGVSASPRVISFDQPVPKGGGTYRVGKPYTVAGRTYVPEENRDYRAEGLASWYGDNFHGRLTANGEVFDMTSLTAAHPTLPLPSYVRVTNVKNGKSLIVRVNDRGPYHGNRVIDVSHRAADLLEFRKNGIARVRVEYVGRAPLEGSDDRQLLATLRTNQPAPTPSAVRIASAAPFVPQMPLVRSGTRGGEIPSPTQRPHTLDTAATGPSEVSARRSMPPGTYVAQADLPGNGITAYSNAASPAPVNENTLGNPSSGRGLY